MPGGEALEGIGIRLRGGRAGEDRIVHTEQDEMCDEEHTKQHLRQCDADMPAEDHAVQNRLLQGGQTGKCPVGEQERDDEERDGGEVMVDEAGCFRVFRMQLTRM